MPSRQDGSGSEFSDWKVTLPPIPPLFIISIVLGPIGTGVVVPDPAESYLEISLINRIIYSGYLVGKLPSHIFANYICLPSLASSGE